MFGKEDPPDATPQLETSRTRVHRRGPAAARRRELTSGRRFQVTTVVNPVRTAAQVRDQWVACLTPPPTANLRAVRSFNRADAAPVANVFPAIRLPRNRRTSMSVANPPSAENGFTRPAGASLTGRPSTLRRRVTLLFSDYHGLPATAHA